MQISENKFIIMLRDKSAYERFLDEDGYLSPYFKDAQQFDLHSSAHNFAVMALDEPELFEVRPLKITYEFDEN